VGLTFFLVGLHTLQVTPRRDNGCIVDPFCHRRRRATSQTSERLALQPFDSIWSSWQWQLLGEYEDSIAIPPVQLTNGEYDRVLQFAINYRA